MKRICRIALQTTVVIALPLSVITGFTQCQNKSGFAKQLCEAKTLAAPSDSKTKPAPASPAQAANALSTGIQDSVSYDTLDASLAPKALKPISDLSRNSDGAFVLERGMYEAVVEAYSLDSGAPGASGFSGFLPATVHGAAAEAIRSLLKYAELHPEVGSPDIQQVLSALASGANYADWTAQARKAATTILPPAVLQPYQAQARHGNQKVLSQLGQKLDKAAAMNPKLKNADDLKNSFGIGQPPPAQQVGAPAALQATPQAQPVPRGTWLEMPGGFYLRYVPEGANRMRIQLFVPDTALVAAKGTALTFDPTEYVAILSQAPYSRVGITLRGVAGLRP